MTSHLGIKVILTHNGIWSGNDPAMTRKMTSDRCRIRRAKPGDVPSLKAQEDRSFAHDRLSVRSLRLSIQSPSQTVLLLESNTGSLLGAAVLHFRIGSRKCRLYSIAVEASGNGLGSILLSACEKAARERGCLEMRLEARTDRPRLIRFYEDRGFRRMGMKPSYYEDGSDALIFAKPV